MRLCDRGRTGSGEAAFPGRRAWRRGGGSGQGARHSLRPECRTGRTMAGRPTPEGFPGRTEKRSRCRDKGSSLTAPRKAGPPGAEAGETHVCVCGSWFHLQVRVREQHDTVSQGTGPEWEGDQLQSLSRLRIFGHMHA